MSCGESGTAPLTGVRVVDLSSLAPGPFATMLLADHGAEVVAVHRPPVGEPSAASILFQRGKRSVVADLKTERGHAFVRRLIADADVVVEGSRPGTMERLGLGPDDLMTRNPRLIYVRLTGWGQKGPYSMRAGHDINFIAIGGPLGVIGSDRPVAPLNFVGDFAGGSLMAVIGVLLAIRLRDLTGEGRVVDVAMSDGATLMASAQLEQEWGPRGTNVFDGNAPHYGVYECADGGWFAVGAVEPKFYAELLAALEIDDVDLASQEDRSQWTLLRQRMASIFSKRTRAEWAARFESFDACGSPVLSLDELGSDPHNLYRQTFVRDDQGRGHAAPAPRLIGSPTSVARVPYFGEHTTQYEEGWPQEKSSFDSSV